MDSRHEVRVREPVHRFTFVNRVLKTSSSGQGALEQMAVYGWAVVIILIVGVVLWQMGVLSPAAAPNTGSSGFQGLRPVEWYCRADTGELTVVLINGVGARLGNATLEGTACLPASIEPGDTATCVLSDPCCAAVPKGQRFDCQLSVSYSSYTGTARSSSGRVWGPVE